MCSPKCKRDRVRDADFQRRYGISLSAWQQMYESQGGVCAVCGTHKTKNRLHVDHCHTTGRVRGLLCSPCNQALGMLHDDAKKIRALAKYVESA